MVIGRIAGTGKGLEVPPQLTIVIILLLLLAHGLLPYLGMSRGEVLLEDGLGAERDGHLQRGNGGHLAVGTASYLGVEGVFVDVDAEGTERVTITNVCVEI